MNPEEKKEQDKWVQKNVFDKSAPCPRGFTWERVPGSRSHGYICNGGNHLVTDEMIADGRGGFWVLPYGQPPSQNFGSNNRGDTDFRVGPYYQHKSGDAWCWAASIHEMMCITRAVGEGYPLAMPPEGQDDMDFHTLQRLFDEFRSDNGLEPVRGVVGSDYSFN